MKPVTLTRKNMLRGALIYSAGDLAACLIQGRADPLRFLGMAAVGGTLYALEIPNYFRWIEGRTTALTAKARTLGRTGLALLYFNPLWIARHLALIRLLTGRPLIPGQLLRMGAVSFLVNIPLSLIANYLIQNRISLKHRFTASALFSAVMAVYYALSEVFFQ